MSEQTIPPLAEMVATAMRRNGEGKALRFHGIWYDWAWMRAVGDRILALLEEAGVREDEAVGVAPMTDPVSAAVLIGLISQTREIVMMYAYQSPAALARKVGELNCAAVIAVDAAWQEPMVEAVNETGAVGITISMEKQEIVPGTAVNGAVEHRLASETRGINLLSSGTTGPPKLRHLDYDVVRRAMVLESIVQPYGGDPAPYPAMHTAAFGNIAGLYAWLPFAISGRSAVMIEKFTLDTYLDYLREFKPPAAGMPPSGYRELLERDIPAEVFEGVHYMGGGASLLDPELQRAVQDKYGFTILQSYGATEFGGVVTMVTPAHIEEFGREKAMSVGRPLAGTGAEFRIMDSDTGEPAPNGTVGILHARIPRVGPDWIVTSDLAWIDDDGFVYYVGRNDGVIVRGGFKVDPEQVRTALLAHPAIYDAMVVPKPDARLGEVPVAAIAVRESHDVPGVDTLKEFLRERLPSTFIPVDYKPVPTIPLTSTGKPDFSTVKKMFA